MQGLASTTIAAALDVVPFAMLITDSSGSALSVNHRWSALSGLSVESSLGLGWLEALTAEARHHLLANLREVAAHSENLTEDYQIGASSQRRWIRWWISHHEVAGVSMLAVAAADVEADYARQADLYHLATHDSLTGLFNRRHFMEAIDQALLRNQRSSRHVGVVYVDLDGFKGVNDRAGHAMGDRVLSAVGARLRHAVRSADLVARIGGDEFAVLCEGLGEEEQAEVVANRIAAALAESVELEGERWSVTASVGAAVDVDGRLTASELIDRADRAMYSIKHTRRRPRPEDPADTDQPSKPGDTLQPPPRPAPSVYPTQPATPAWGPTGGSSVAARPPVDAPPPVDRRVTGRRATDLAPARPYSSYSEVNVDTVEDPDVRYVIASLKESIESLRSALEQLLSSGRRASDWNPSPSAPTT
ncbi:MAG: diguanylate cyclase domain-containing protein [Acidimicrobiales bacterium]